MKFISKLQKNGLINLPVSIRKALGLNAGDIVVFKISEKRKMTITVNKFREGEDLC